MEWTRSELISMPDRNVEFDEEVEISPEAFASNTRINGVKDLHVSGKGYLDEADDRFYVTLEISGIMLVPDAVNGKEIEYPFETGSEEEYVFDENTEEDDVRIVTDEVIRLLPAVIEDILLEVPLQVTECDPEDYPSGDGWQILTEEAYQKSREEEIDPRLAILKNYKQD